MGVILREDHIQILEKTKRRAMIIHLLGIGLVIVLLIIPWIFKIERDLVTEAYRMAKMEFDTVLAKQELINLLKSKPLTVGQALDISDIIISQSEIPIPLVLGIIAQESEFRPEAISSKGARGLMQVMPLVYKTYIHFSVLDNKRQMHDPVTNVRIGISYLANLKQKYGDWKKVLRVYQAGPQNAENRVYDWYVNAVLKKAERFRRK